MTSTPPEQVFKPSNTRPHATLRWHHWRVMLPVCLAIIGLLTLSVYFDWNARVIAGVAVLIGLLTGAFAWLIGLLGLLPVIGPIIVKVLSFGFIWLINAIGYCISIIAIRRGYSKDVLTYRGLTMALLIGILIGYIIAQYL